MGSHHRKQVRSYNTPGHAHELTFSCFHRLPLLNRDRTRHWFLDALDTARLRRNLALWAYVIMPEHVHVIVWPREPVYEVRLIRTALKVPVQRKALAFLRSHAPAFLDRLRDEQPNGEVHYRFWQRGGSYDRNVTDPTTLRAMISTFTITRCVGDWSLVRRTGRGPVPGSTMGSGTRLCRWTRFQPLTGSAASEGEHAFAALHASGAGRSCGRAAKACAPA